MARVGVPFYTHRVTDGGDRRQQTFFGDDDYSTYIALMGGFCRKIGPGHKGARPRNKYTVPGSSQLDRLIQKK